MVREPPSGADFDPSTEARAEMIAEINAEVALTSRWLGKDTLDPAVIAVMARVPRHDFVPPRARAAAYDNQPLSIGYGQTISQPYMVAVMTDLAAVGPGDRVLEIGTGCGYQAAVLAELADRVYTIETVPQLADRAAARLERLGYDKVEVRVGDGSLGWPEEAPFDAVVVTAAAQQRVPEALIDQLAPGGRLVIPVQRGTARLPFLSQPEQELLLLTKDRAGRVTRTTVLPVAFVPLVEAPPGGTAD